MPGRKVTRAASVTTSGAMSAPSRVRLTAQKLAATAATGATIGAARAACSAVIAIRRPRDRRPPLRSPRASLRPEPVRQRSAGEPVSRELERPRPPERPGLDTREGGERLVRIEAPAEILDELVEPGDRVEVDHRRSHTKRVAALMGIEPSEISTIVGVAEISVPTSPSASASASTCSSRSAVGYPAS